MQQQQPSSSTADYPPPSYQTSQEEDWGKWHTWSQSELQALQQFAAAPPPGYPIPPPQQTSPSYYPSYPPPSQQSQPQQTQPSMYPPLSGKDYPPPPSYQYPPQYTQYPYPPPYESSSSFHQPWEPASSAPPFHPSYASPSSSQPQSFGGSSASSSSTFVPSTTTEESATFEKDKTSNFHQIYKSISSPEGPENLIQEQNLRNYDIYLVGGLYNEKNPNYMKCHIDYMEKMGLNVKKLPIDPTASLEDNAKGINDFLLSDRASTNSQRKAILVGHSKGGTDLVAAMAMFPNLQQFVETIVTMQSPFKGSPLAGDLMSSLPLKQLLNPILRKLKLDPTLLEGLNSSKRQQFFQEHDLSSLAVPVISLATITSSKNSLLYPLAEYMKRKFSVESDGIVATKDASLPFSYTVTLDGIDHSATVFESELGEGDTSKGLLSGKAKFIAPLLLLALIVLAIIIARKVRKSRRH